MFLLKISRDKNQETRKHSSDAREEDFVGLLESTSDWNNKQVGYTIHFYPSRKTGCGRGWIIQELNLWAREWV
jgi:hypothetical protein